MSRCQILKCSINNCDFNKSCPGCNGLSKSHLKSDIRCDYYEDSWAPLPPNFKLIFHKIIIKDCKEQENIKLCSNHKDYYDICIELNEKIKTNDENIIEISSAFFSLIKDFPECNEYNFTYFEFFINFLNNKIKFIQNNQQEKEIFRSLFKIINFCLIKEVTFKEKLSNDEIFLNICMKIIKDNEKNIKLDIVENIYIIQIMFLLSNLILFKDFKKSMNEEIFNFCLKYLDVEDLKFKYQLISLLWSLCYENTYKNKIKEERKLYFFKFYNDNYQNFDVLMHNLILGFLFNIYNEEIQVYLLNREKLEEFIEIQKTADLIKQYQNIFSNSIQNLIVKSEILKI